ncbi:heme transporter [Anaerostipes caccae L1-92]|nr:heme transporter [Anaerostipes caccae L1-92]
MIQKAAYMAVTVPAGLVCSRSEVVFICFGLEHLHHMCPSLKVFTDYSSLQRFFLFLKYYNTDEF